MESVELEAGPLLPLAAAWIRDGRVIGNARWRGLDAARWQPRARVLAGAEALATLVLAQHAAAQAARVFLTGTRAIEVQLGRDDAGLPLAIAHDVSALVQEAMLDELRMQQRLAGEEFHLRRVMHDLGNSFHAIELRVSFRQTIADMDARADALLHDIEKTTLSARHRIEQLQQLMRHEQYANDSMRLGGPCRVHDAIARAAALALRDGARVTLAPSLGELPRADIDGDDLAILSLLLFDNAREAEAAALVDGALVDGRVVIDFSDDGPGIADEIATKMWKPFFSTRGPGHRGHGLAHAVELARRAGGTLKARNRDGGGARFTLTLPMP